MGLVAAVSACSSSPLRLVESDSPEPSGMEALLRGTLAADANGCIQVKSNADAVTPVWPRGYSVRGDSNSFEILDGNKTVIARSGTALAIGGGGAEKVQEAWTERDCASSKLWMVGHVRTA